MKTFAKAIFGLLTIGGFLCQQAHAAMDIGDSAGTLAGSAAAQHAFRFSLGAGPQLPTPAAPAPFIVGNITFAGTVTLDPNDVNTATRVTSWAGPPPAPSPSPGPTSPVVQSRDGSFAATVNVGDLTTFVAPWVFNTNVTITNFWSVDNFTFDLTASHIAFQGSGFLVAQGTGVAKASGFTNTPGTWNFTTQGPSASGQFSFSASTAVPEGNTVALLGIGALGITCAHFLRRKRKPPEKMNTFKAFFLGKMARFARQ